MTAVETPSRGAASTTQAGVQARVRFRQPVSTDGFVDAAWWPRSRDLDAEIGPLLETLWAAGRDVDRVAFNTDYWTSAQRRIVVDGHRVRLGSFAQQDRLMVELTDAWRTDHIDMLVIDPDTGADLADRIMANVSDAGNNDRPAEILRKAA